MYFYSKCLNKQKRTSGLDIKTIKFIILNRRPTSLNSHLQLNINDCTMTCQSLPTPQHTAWNSYWLGSRTTTVLFDPWLDLLPAAASCKTVRGSKKIDVVLWNILVTGITFQTDWIITIISCVGHRNDVHVRSLHWLTQVKDQHLRWLFKTRALK